ncbi:hypothetical protein E2542_SST12942 [Spatholobus suberectus]|nr:hypothetical protein E2542_SST12942 [Spatholobus suberectus]
MLIVSDSWSNLLPIATMRIYDEFKEILKIQKFRRLVSYTGFYCFATLITYAYVSNTTRAGYSRADQFYCVVPCWYRASNRTVPSYIKLLLETALKLKNGVHLNSASWQNTSSVKESRHTHIMRAIYGAVEFGKVAVFSNA